jgi:hypothetical protein
MLSATSLLLLAASGCSWLPLAAHGCRWLAAAASPQLPEAAPGYPWLVLATSENTTPGWSSLLQKTNQIRDTFGHAASYAVSHALRFLVGNHSRGAPLVQETLVLPMLRATCNKDIVYASHHTHTHTRAHARTRTRTHIHTHARTLNTPTYQNRTVIHISTMPYHEISN